MILTGSTVCSGKAGSAAAGSDEFVTAAARVAAVAVGAPGARLWNTETPDDLRDKWMFPVTITLYKHQI